MSKLALKSASALAMLAFAIALPAAAAESTSLKALPAPAPTPAAPPVAVTTTVTTTALPAPAPMVVPGSPPPSNLTTSPTTPKIVQQAVDGLQKTDPINLDDMIRAQDAINRLDLLLEIEKRQTELKKLRDERNKPSTLSAGIPASALNLPPIHTAAVSTMPRPISAPPPVSSSGYSLKRIEGSDGRYSAVLGDGDKMMSVHQGETLPDGSKVKAVSLTSVSLIKDKKSKTLTIPSDSYIVRGSEEVTE